MGGRGEKKKRVFWAFFELFRGALIKFGGALIHGVPSSFLGVAISVPHMYECGYSYP